MKRSIELLGTDVAPIIRAAQATTMTGSHFHHATYDGAYHYGA